MALVTITNRIAITDAPAGLRQALAERLTFDNPAWIENNRMDRWNGNTPRYLRFYEEAGDSLGGTIDVRIDGMPRGLGEPIFGKLKALIPQALGSVGAVTGVVWGLPTGNGRRFPPSRSIT